MTEIMKVAMARGGYVKLKVIGSIYTDYLQGRSSKEVHIESIQWPNGGEVKEKNLADPGMVEEDFKQLVLSYNPLI